MKVWKDAGEIAKTTLLKEELYKYDNLMKSKPNFDKTQGAKKVYQRKHFILLKASDGYIVYNTKKLFEKGHTHIKSFHKAKSIIDLAVRKKMPNRPIKWEIESLIRISNDSKYINKLREL
ncbi:hypothetical protein [Romboutsia sp.]|uniref:hypothetical protein n=1 Tax=Romboutsia sp. TaxID=1965302 RepID=UPI002CBCD6FE|nr:hypothetical protein [Romboutsia sp.]HSQ90010.1 hypothetical protein [Romboutsia sp.]